MFLLLIVPVVACGSTTGTAMQSGGDATATHAATVAPVAAGRATAAARSAAPSTATGTPYAAWYMIKVYPPNHLVSVKNWDMAINRVERPGKELVWSDGNDTSVAAGEWLIVVFDLKNTGTTGLGINPTDVQLDASGPERHITYTPSTDGGALSYSTFKQGQQLGGQVPPGVSVQYFIPFDIAPNATTLIFQFNQDTEPKFLLP